MHRSYRTLLAEPRRQVGGCSLCPLLSWPPPKPGNTSPGKFEQVRQVSPSYLNPPHTLPGKFAQPPALEPRVQRPLNRTRFHLCSSSLLRESGDKLQISSRENWPRKSKNDILGAEGPEGYGSAGQGYGRGGYTCWPWTEQRLQGRCPHPQPLWSLRFIRAPITHLTTRHRDQAINGPCPWGWAPQSLQRHPPI